MSEEVEQITKTPPACCGRGGQDPKKVVAARKLAEYNKTVKEVLERESKRKSRSSEELRKVLGFQSNLLP